MPVLLEGEHHLKKLLAVAGLLHIGQTTAATVGYPRLSYFRDGNGIFGTDIFWPDYTLSLIHI